LIKRTWLLSGRGAVLTHRPGLPYDATLLRIDHPAFCITMVIWRAHDGDWRAVDE